MDYKCIYNLWIDEEVANLFLERNQFPNLWGYEVSRGTGLAST